jgi:hypothetical protein
MKHVKRPGKSQMSFVPPTKFKKSKIFGIWLQKKVNLATLLFI